MGCAHEATLKKENDSSSTMKRDEADYGGEDTSFLRDAFHDMISSDRGLSTGQKMHLIRMAALDPLRSMIKNMTGIGGYGLRQIYYRKHLRSMGEDCLIGEYVFMDLPDRISLGSHVMIDCFARLEGGRGIAIGDRCHICSGTVINGAATVKIGRYVGVSAGTKIYSATETWRYGKRMSGPMAPLEERAVLEKPIVIGDNAFFGINSIILPGVTIGEGAVVGAGSLVKKSVPPWKVVQGNPAKVVCDRPPLKL
jgi:acetyltransferase-like isoleucine patch superfamily enzyme